MISSVSTMASSSTSFVQKSYKYDVFLSFRGEDTRTNFVDHLYHALQQKGIHTYKDAERIKKGKKISDELIGSIQDSKFYIIVFSKNYASSSWCLDELLKIMECHKTAEHTAYPVFYDVEPSKVRKQSGEVGKLFAELENEKAAGKWRAALKEAADLAGWELKNTAHGHEAKFIQKIVEEISLELRAINFDSDEKLVGMETRINDVLSSLGTGFDDVCMIGIKGIGGGGKTTLARAVFDQISFQFEGKSFVENVREVSAASSSGLKSLQNQILSDVLNDQGIYISSVYDGKNMIKRRMPCKKVLLVLDDVDHIEQLEALAGETNWFKPGSRIIITTRDEQVLVAHRVKSIHNVQLLLDEEAIRLFSRHAFGRVIPDVGYEELSRQVIRYAAGLPLTIRVLGSFLCGKNELEWRDALERLKTIPLKETLKKLELSYSSLEEDYKEIFLNVACILKGWLKALAINALESCGFHARNGLRVLQQRSLITVNHDGYLGMHDHIEEMGRNIVRCSHPNNPKNHSRLWITTEIEDIFANNKGSEATRYIRFHTLCYKSEIAMKGLLQMKELIFLDVSFHDLSEDDFSHENWKFNNFPNTLQYLRWNYYPFRFLPKTFKADNLVTLEMADSNIVQLWEGGERKVLNKVRFLDLSNSKLRSFNLGLTPNIETLNLQRCGQLVELYMLGGCSKLITVDLSYSMLRTLNLRSASHLELLDLDRCLDLVELHMPGRSPYLRSLKLGRSKLRTLDIGLTPNLEYLDLSYCYDLEEFHMAGECQKLASLFISYSKLRNLDLKLAPSLKELKLEKCNDLEDLHMVDDCQKLTLLNITSCSKLRNLDLRLTPNVEDLKLENCNDLEELYMADDCQNLTLLNITSCSKLRNLDLGLTPSLKEIKLEKCNYLEELHMADDCQKLTLLNITNCSKLRNLDLRLTPSLEELKLENCNDLEELFMADDCHKLTFLKIRCSRLRKLDIPLTPNLRSLDLKGCYNLVDFHIPKECLKKVVYLDLSGCLRFTSFKFQIMRVSSRSENESFEVDHFSELHLIAKSLDGCPIHPDSNLPKFQFKCFYKEDQPLLTTNLEKLSSVGLCPCTNLDTFSRSICGLQRLRKLKLEGSVVEAPQHLDQLECLEELDFSYTKIKDLPDSICMLKNLESLEFNHCWFLEKLPEDLGRLDCLKKLTLICAKIKTLPDSICMLRYLESLTLYWCSSLEKLPKDLGRLKCLKKLSVRSAKIKDLPDSICMLKHLESLELDDCLNLEKLPKDLGRLECLEMLNLSCCKLLQNIPDSICDMKCLKYLNLWHCVQLEKLPEEIGRLECLQILDITRTSISHIPLSICLWKGLRIFR